MNATKYTSVDNEVKYHVGDYFITFIDKEQYDEILAEVGREVELGNNRHIIYMRDCSPETKSKYAKMVIESPLHKNKSLEEYDRTIKDLTSQLRSVEYDRDSYQTLKELIID